MDAGGGVRIVESESRVRVAICVGTRRTVKVRDRDATRHDIAIIDALREHVSVYGIKIVTRDLKAASNIVGGPKYVSISGIIICTADWIARKCRHRSWCCSSRGRWLSYG